jgi:uncharacterized membrane protein YdbT with pleckstrin-like domain
VKLSPGETIIFQGRPSWRSIVGFYLLGLLVAAGAGVIGAVIAKEASVGIAVGVGAFLLVLVAGFLKRFFSRYTITTRRLRVQRGVLRRQIQETRLERLQDHSITQTLLERMLRVGTIDFDTSGEEHADLFRFVGIEDPEGLVNTIDRVTSQSIGTAASIPPAADPPPPQLD